MSTFAPVGKNSRSIAAVVISVGCSAAHSNIISDSLITPAKNASVLVDHCWNCEFLRTSKTFHCREIVDCSHCIGKSRFCCHLSSKCKVEVESQLAPSSSTSLLLRMRFRKCSSCVSRNNKQQRSGKTRSTRRLHSSGLAGRLFTTQTTNRATITLRNQSPRFQRKPRYAAMTKQYDCVSHYAVKRFLEPFTECAPVSDDKDRYYTWSGLRD